MARPINSSDVFRAIAHPARRRILELLRERTLTPNDIAKSFDVSQPTISGHLRALRETGLIAFKTRGNQHVYSIVKPALRPIQAWVSGFKA